MFAGSIPNSFTFSSLVETATKWRATACSLPNRSRAQALAVCALVMVSWVVKVFEATTNSVSSASRSAGGLHEVRRVHVGDEAEGELPTGVVPQGLVGHHRAQVRAADPDVDHVADGPARCGPTIAARAPVRRSAPSARSTACTSGTTLWPSTSMRASAGARSATWSTARPSVRLIASPLYMASRRSASPHSRARATQQPDRLVGDPVLGVVQVQAAGLGGQPGAPLGVIPEQLAQVQVLDLLVVSLEGLPGR